MIIILLMMALSAWYIPSRVKKCLNLSRIWPWRLAIFLFLAGYIVLLMFGAYTSTNILAAAVCNIYGLAFIFYVGFLFCLAIAHLLNPLIKKTPGKILVTAAVILSLGYVVYGFVQAQNFTVTRYELPVKGLEEKVDIIHISDLHLGAQRGQAYLNKVIQSVNENKPDIILFNGDLVDSNIALTPTLFALFGNLSGEAYFTTGNHEYYIDTNRALELIEEAGLKILRNEMVETHGLQLIGLEYMNADRHTYDGHMVNDLTIEEELPKIIRDRHKPALVMHHSPVGLEYVIQGGADIMLSGHTHGGQLFPGTLLAWLRFPLLKGLYEIDGTRFLVSQGAGTFGPWMRAGTFNEIQFIRLVPEAGQALTD